MGANLPTTTVDWDRVRARAKELNSDGCTGVKDFYKDCCLLHDIYYRTGADLDGQPVTRREADALLRDCIRSRSRLGKWSPLALVRWTGTRLLGGLRGYGPKSA